MQSQPRVDDCEVAWATACGVAIAIATVAELGREPLRQNLVESGDLWRVVDRLIAKFLPVCANGQYAVSDGAGGRSDIEMGIVLDQATTWTNFLVDTGFNGFIAMPKKLVNQLGLSFLGGTNHLLMPKREN